ncbi:MAG: PEP-CTERM sorting domain-containing protein [Pseudomonadota bacterium]|nr:PEP-CTERM sorting domain-containing protein [Pseudomonadota bacterium]
MLDLSVLINPSPVPSGAGTSTNILVNAGQISVVNVDPTAILGLTVPEPATVMLIAAGLVGIFAARRRITV